MKRAESQAQPEISRIAFAVVIFTWAGVFFSPNLMAATGVLLNSLEKDQTPGIENSEEHQARAKMNATCARIVSVIGTTPIPYGSFTQRFLQEWQGVSFKGKLAQFGPQTKKWYEQREDWKQLDAQKKIVQAARMKEKQLEYQNPIRFEHDTRSDGLDVTVTNESALRHEPTGDIFDYLRGNRHENESPREHSRRPFGFFIGDASSHDVIAGQASVFVHWAINTPYYRDMYDVAPGTHAIDLVKRARAEPDYTFVKRFTYVHMAHAKIDPVKNTLENTSIGLGHNFIVHAKEKRIELLDTEADIVSLSDNPLETNNSPTVSQTHKLTDGAVVFLMTDGIAERIIKGTDTTLQDLINKIRHGEALSATEQKFIDLLIEHSTESSSEAHRFLMRSLTPQISKKNNQPLHDDSTVIVYRHQFLK